MFWVGDQNGLCFKVWVWDELKFNLSAALWIVFHLILLSRKLLILANNNQQKGNKSAIRNETKTKTILFTGFNASLFFQSKLNEHILVFSGDQCVFLLDTYEEILTVFKRCVRYYQLCMVAWNTFHTNRANLWILMINFSYNCCGNI